MKAKSLDEEDDVGMRSIYVFMMMMMMKMKMEMKRDRGLGIKNFGLRILV